ncbi:MAG: hypothetical protein MUE47_11115 [Acidobacteria bacterium]|nr:hypothetical protein [Acidobacteriota bacterium]
MDDRELLAQRVEDHPQDLEVALVELDPLQEQAVGRQAVADLAVELAGEERVGAGGPGVAGLGHDEIPGLSRLPDDERGIARPDPQSRIAIDRAGEFGEQRQEADGGRGDLRHIELSHVVVEGQAADGDARP